MKYPKVTVLPSSDNSFVVCVPLWGKDIKEFQRELKLYFERRGEEIDPSTLTVFTKLKGKQLECLSNKIIRKILKERSKKNGKTV